MSVDPTEAGRAAVVWCPDWPVVAHRRPPQEPVAVVHANRVVAASASARAEGVRRGLRRREAQGRCPSLVVLERDLGLEARVFDVVVGALEDLTPRVEIVRPGLVVFPARAPARYFGGDEAMARHGVALVGASLADNTTVVGPGSPAVTGCIGVADSVFGATVAARHAGAVGGVLVVDQGTTAAFLAPRPVRLLERPMLTDVLLRLGVHTLGDFAALSPLDVMGRFGAEGAAAHRLASGHDLHPPALTDPPPETEIAVELDPPVERVDQAAFSGKVLADELLTMLADRGASCSRVMIVAETEYGETHTRFWRHEGALTAAAIADRVRWQLDGWLNGSSARRPSGGITRLAVRPDEVMPAGGRQLGFWGDRIEVAEGVARVVARVQGLLGGDAVRVPERRAGRSPQERIVTVVAEAVDLGRNDITPAHADGNGSTRYGRRRSTAVPVDPWPGSLPDPAPVRVHEPPLPAQVVDHAGVGVSVDARAIMSASPVALAVADAAPVAVAAWAGPWPLDERWWDPERRRRRARLQVVDAEGVARLLVVEGGRWWVEATYD